MPALIPVLMLLLLVAGCATTPDALRDVPEGFPDPERVRDEPAAHEGEAVRWGGRIVDVENAAGETRVIVLARALDGRGRPGDSDGGGRFLARFDGFLDPAEYAAGRELTVVGEVAGVATRDVGEYPYRHPVVDVRSHVLWAEPEPAPPPLRYYDPWYGPYYGPYYPYRHPWYWP